jgi:hypothetical protein
MIAASSPALRYQSCLRLVNWSIDRPLGTKLAKTMPLLRTLVLKECHINSGGWAALQSLTQLESLFVEEDVTGYRYMYM